MTDDIKILIVDDHTLVRKGLVALLDGHHNMKVIGEASEGFEAVTLTESLNPDVVLMDLEIPQMDGAEATLEIKKRKLDSKVLVLTSYKDHLRVISAIRAGADGYLLKTTLPQDLIRAIVDVYNGRTPLDPAISGTVLRELSQDSSKSTTLIDELSEREVTVLELISKGYTNRQIAAELSISDRTVSTHVSHILVKLQVDNRTQAAFIALKSGLVNFDSD